MPLTLRLRNRQPREDGRFNNDEHLSRGIKAATKDPRINKKVTLKVRDKPRDGIKKNQNKVNSKKKTRKTKNTTGIKIKIPKRDPNHASLESSACLAHTSTELPDESEHHHNSNGKRSLLSWHNFDEPQSKRPNIQEEEEFVTVRPKWIIDSAVMIRDYPDMIKRYRRAISKNKVIKANVNVMMNTHRWLVDREKKLADIGLRDLANGQNGKEIIEDGIYAEKEHRAMQTHKPNSHKRQRKANLNPYAHELYRLLWRIEDDDVIGGAAIQNASPRIPLRIERATTKAEGKSKEEIEKEMKWKTEVITLAQHVKVMEKGMGLATKIVASAVPAWIVQDLREERERTPNCED